MNNELDILLSDIELPSVDIELAAEKPSPETSEVKFSDVPETAGNQILAEGAADFKDHPQLEPFLKSLNDLQAEFYQKVKEASQEYELCGFAKVLFSIRKKA